MLNLFLIKIFLTDNEKIESDTEDQALLHEKSTNPSDNSACLIEERLNEKANNSCEIKSKNNLEIVDEQIESTLEIEENEQENSNNNEKETQNDNCNKNQRYVNNFCSAEKQKENHRACKVGVSFTNKILTPISYNLNELRLVKTDNQLEEEFKLEENEDKTYIGNSEPILELNEEIPKCFETPKPTQTSDEAINSEKNEVSEFYSRYNALDKSSSLLSFKRRREQLIKESYEAFGFSFDSGINLKKGFSKVEREKQIEKNKRDNQILNNIEINSDTLIQKNSLNEATAETKAIENKNKTFDSSTNFMHDSISKKSRVEKDKEVFLEQQKKQKEQNTENKPADEPKNLVIEANSNNNYLSYKQRKQALLDSTNNGIKKNFEVFNFINFF